MALEQMTPEQETKLAGAINRMGELIEQGVQPTEALYKVASREQIPAGHVRLMAEAYNVGRTLSQLNSTDQLHEKLAEFPLADAADVLERMFPSQVKTASQQYHAQAVSADYRLPPHYWVERAKTAEKQAAARQIDLREAYAKRDGRTEPLPTLPSDPRAPIKAAFDQRRNIERATEELRLRMIGAQYAALESLQKVAAYFRQSVHLPLEAVRENVVAVHGSRGGALMSKVAELLGDRGREFGPLNMKQAYQDLAAYREKNAAYEAGQATPSIWDDPPPTPPPTLQRKEVKTASRQHFVNWDAAPYSLVADCFAACERSVAAKVVYEAGQQEAHEKIAEALRPFVQPVSSEIYGSIWDAVSPTDGTKQADALSIGAAGILGGYAKGLGEAASRRYDAQLQSTVNRLGENDGNLRAIQTRAMLHDMMQNDAVISGYGPDQVVDAFNRISEVAPRAAQHRLVAQSLIRKYLSQASAVDPFDVDQLLGVEKKLVDRDPTARPQLAG